MITDYGFEVGFQKFIITSQYTTDLDPYIFDHSSFKFALIEVLKYDIGFMINDLKNLYGRF